MDIIKEYEFWATVLTHHMEFIQNGLSAQKVLESDIEKQLYDTATLYKSQLASFEVDEKPETAKLMAELAERIKDFKSEILALHINRTIAISLPPTFINHMINEVNECITVFTHFANNSFLPDFYNVYQHKLWLLDAAGHSDAIISQLDPTEVDVRKKLKKLKNKFFDLYSKAVEYAGYLEATGNQFPALDQLDMKAGLEITVFLGMLNELHKNRLNADTLGTIMPLMLEHMILEENYYLSKIQ